MLPTQLLSRTLNTSVSPARMEEVNINGAQTSILLNVLKGGGTQPGEPPLRSVQGGWGPKLDGAC